jgi:hypothetical protein
MVNEWTVLPGPGGPRFHIHGGVGDLGDEDVYLERRPWEAFAGVGFRTVLKTGDRQGY